MPAYSLIRSLSSVLYVQKQTTSQKLCGLLNMRVYRSGRLHAKARKRESSGGDKGAEREVESRVGHGAAGGGSHHGVGDASVLHPHHGRLCDETDDARHAAHAVRISARLPAPQPFQRRLEVDAHLGQTDRRGQREILFVVAAAANSNF